MKKLNSKQKQIIKWLRKRTKDKNIKDTDLIKKFATVMTNPIKHWLN